MIAPETIQQVVDALDRYDQTCREIQEEAINKRTLPGGYGIASGWFRLRCDALGRLIGELQIIGMQIDERNWRGRAVFAGLAATSEQGMAFAARAWVNAARRRLPQAVQS